MIQVRQLGKRMGQRVVFRRLDFAWSDPSMICVCGVNGSGKTTLLSMLAGATPPDAGDILLQGRSLVAEREAAARLVSYVPDDCPIYPFISGREWLAFTKSIRPSDAQVERDLVERFGLEPHLDTRFGDMSLGTAKKFLLASALMCTTPVLILDEPTNGLDKASFEVLQQCLTQRKADGMVVLSCHDVAQQRLLGARPVELSELEAA